MRRDAWVGRSRGCMVSAALAMVGVTVAACQNEGPRDTGAIALQSAGAPVSVAAVAPPAPTPPNEATAARRSGASTGTIAPPPSVSRQAVTPVAAGKAAPAPVATAAAPVILRPASRHVVQFYQPSIKVYDRPYGNAVATLSEHAFPRQRIDADRTGVPVYAINPSFVEVPIPGGSTGWVAIEFVKMTAVPCASTAPATRSAPGPIGAGSSSVDCVATAR